MKYWLTIALFFLTSSALAVPMANRHVQTGYIPCDGQNIEGRNNLSAVLDYGQATQVHAVSIILDELGPNQTGRADISQDFPQPSGQFRFLSLFDPDRYAWVQYSPNTIQLPAAQAIAYEFTCAGGGTRKWTFEVWFTGS